MGYGWSIHKNGDWRGQLERVHRWQRRVTLAANVGDIAALSLRQRVLRDVSKLTTETELFGQTLAMPVVLSPVGLAGMYARRGEAQAAKAAKAAGVPFTLSTVGVCTAAEVARAAGTPPWLPASPRPWSR